MCTSFIFRGNDTIISMNYDNYGNNLKVAPYDRNLFLVTTKLNGQTRPLFGIKSNGVFVNQQFVSECEGGKFRVGEDVVTTIDFVEEVLLNELPMSKIDKYLLEHQIVSPPAFMLRSKSIEIPNFHIHSMLADISGDGYIIEPGRGIFKFNKKKDYVVLSNCSLYEAQQTGHYEGFGADRQITVEEMLEKADESFDITDAFTVLKAVQLFNFHGFCSTEFSFVYSANENAVYYCYNREFDNITKYQMQRENDNKLI